MNRYIIQDWAGNTVLPDQFKSFDDAEEFLSCHLDNQGLDYDENRGEYEIVELIK